MKKAGLYKRMLHTSVTPILILGIVITCLCYVRFKNTIYAEARDGMKNVAEAVMYAYDLAYSGDYYIVTGLNNTYDLYKGETKLTGVYDIVDKVAESTGDEVSLLYMDMRVNTTFGRDIEKRLVGICTNEETSSRVLKNGEEVFYVDVLIAGGHFLVLYVPLKNADGTIIGIVEVAKDVHDMRIAVMKAVWPVILIAFLGMVLAICFTLSQNKEITDVLKKVQLFMNNVAGGKLSSELDASVTIRTDELGEISRSAVSMQRSIREFVETDPLTKLGNRRFISASFLKIQEKAKANGNEFALAIADIDFFKKVNDTYGHNAGDDVLKEIATILKESMKNKGFAGRWGGEEFILVFDKSGMYEAGNHLWTVLEKIRETVVHSEGYDIKVTMTFGVMAGTDQSIEEIVEGADEKLYYGKQNGRNQVVTDIKSEPDES